MAITMNKLLLSIVVAILLSSSSIKANKDELVREDADAVDYQDESSKDPQDHGSLPASSPLNLLRKSVMEEVSTRGDIYDRDDIEMFFNGDRGSTAEKFLLQAQNDWRRAYKLAVQTLRWRAHNGISHLRASDFPCNLFNLGLIFEEGTSRSGRPVIWIRLAALGSVVKYMERIDPRTLLRRAPPYALNKASSLWAKARYLLSSSRRDGLVQTERKVPFVEPYSMSRKGGINHVLKSIVWWLDEWQKEHDAHEDATLVLDFENTDYAFSSEVLAGFFLKLDDRFPTMFDRVIMYRYRPHITSMHSPISALNLLVRSHLRSSMTTFSKLSSVRHEADISKYIARVDVDGKLLLPKYINGECVGPIYEKPDGCLEDSTASTYASTYTDIYNQFYQLCKPIREDD